MNCRNVQLRWVVIFVFLTTAAQAEIICVDANSPNAPGTGAPLDPFRRIQDAIDNADNADIIEVRPGIYTGLGNFALDPNGKTITIRSTNPADPAVVAATVIDPNNAGRAFYFHSQEDANCLVSGFTITNGYADGGSGGAIYCENSALRIENCIISKNSADLYGGAIFATSSDCQINNCQIISNTAVDGAGLECWQGSVILNNCILSDNHASGNGGGVDCYLSGNVTLVNCTLVANQAVSGGGVYCLDSQINVENCIFWANNASQGPQISLPALFDTSSTGSVYFSDFHAGQTGVFVELPSTLIWDQNNIQNDPCFASFSISSDPLTWDFHLRSAAGRLESIIYVKSDLKPDGLVNMLDYAEFAKSWYDIGADIDADLNNDGQVGLEDLYLFVAEYLVAFEHHSWAIDDVTSPCIDTGDTGSDSILEPWPNGKRINIGAFGGTEYASKNGNPADFNIDDAVDMYDWAGFASKWHTQQKCIQDLNTNGLVNIDDLKLFLENWLWKK